MRRRIPLSYEVLREELGIIVREDIIPEFPVRKGSLSSGVVEDNRSFKIDYLAFTQDGQPVFIEHKTDRASRNDPQNQYLLEAQKAGLRLLLHGLLEVAKRSKAKRKYGYLLARLEMMGLLNLHRVESRL